MPRDKDFKRLVRSRMQKTGEAYTTARSHVLSRSPKTEADPEAAASGDAMAADPATSAPASASASAPEATADLPSLAGMSDEKVKAATERDWAEWVRLLDGEGAAGMPHPEIVRLLRTRYGVQDWWTQMVTVGYERIKGLRERGQRRGGGWDANKSRTFPLPVEALFDACADEKTRRRWLEGEVHHGSAAPEPPGPRGRRPLQGLLGRAAEGAPGHAPRLDLALLFR